MCVYFNSMCYLSAIKIVIHFDTKIRPHILLGEVPSSQFLLPCILTPLVFEYFLLDEKNIPGSLLHSADLELVISSENLGLLNGE